MEVTYLNAVDRIMKPKQCRETGFTPGVLYGDGVSNAISVQFETAELKKVIATHGSNARVWVNHGGNKKFGFIKEVQRDPVSASVIHIDVFHVSQDHEVNMQIPITFEGRDSLDNLLLQVYKSEVEVLGKLTMMPEAIVVDVATMLLGDTITSENFKLDAQLKITESENEVYGIITLLPVLVEEPEVVVAEETSTTTAETK